MLDVHSCDVHNNIVIDTEVVVPIVVGLDYSINSRLRPCRDEKDEINLYEAGSTEVKPIGLHFVISEKCFGSGVELSTPMNSVFLEGERG